MAFYETNVSNSQITHSTTAQHQPTLIRYVYRMMVKEIVFAFPNESSVFL